MKLRLKLSILLLVVTLSVSFFSINNNKQLEFMGGMAEEYFYLGLNLHDTGEFCPDSEVPCLLRPPGYPFFIASVFTIWGGLPDRDAKFKNLAELNRRYHEAYNIIYIAQCLLLGLSTVIIFLLMSNWLRIGNAFVAALLFGCNPYLIILTGLLHYDVLHIFLTLLSCYVLNIFIDDQNRFGVKMILAGVFWGLTTLTRPMTLIMPFFVFIMLLIKPGFSSKHMIKGITAFTLGMILTVAPYTIRNYVLTDRIIPVNAQGNVALWAATSKQADIDSNHYGWWKLWYSEGMKIYSRVTNSSQSSYSEYLTYNLKLEDEFRKEAIKNLLNQPEVFIHNAAQNFTSFVFDINSIFIQFFQFIQHADNKIDKNIIEVGSPQDFYPSSTAKSFEYFVNILTLFSFLGIFIAFRKKDTYILVPGLVLLNFCIAHSITYMDLMYYYIKMPFLFIFTAYFINETNRFNLIMPGMNRNISCAFALNSLLIVFELCLIITVL